IKTRQRKLVEGGCDGNCALCSTAAGCETKAENKPEAKPAEKAAEEGLTVLASNLPVYETAVRLYEAGI
ncbi:MAG: hypothetical protein IK029_02915, partial [Oscillospiraceae bacterium]|nr:hypothetical protein [Oscillospiraceae bacterium]